ncbi:hypothetical protein K432DRAFT_385071 [Lepidopterella palustris CBS 459.81]|uniref:ACB domain-containing protein n=1 Tax=Lepidopterella palustris CBS 459.81 TaxID=1314670 RepID=A0A8E2JC31_9PEZI|nr:hypothetical protein K432DRAFT_385071 [Lepidopterella palustris CBS 459.81]
MSDSVDRVFSHALNTVNKIRTGSQKPPSAIRLKLYGLYKQSMEGDVDGIMERPEGSGDEAHRAREKWDAWKHQNGLSRTEAKRRYITTLIDTMHKFASPSPDSRELVAELEFVWDQVKSNVPSSSSSSPLQTLGTIGLHMPLNDPALGSSHGSRDYRSPDQIPPDAPLRVRSPMSQDEEEGLDDNGEEFVDAQDSQYNPNLDHEEGSEHHDQEQEANYDRSITRPQPPSQNPSDQKWRRRVERALVKMTAEVAALREQLESRRLFSHSRQQTFFNWTLRFCWAILKHIVVDFVVLGIVLLWMRRKKDRRLEGAVRVLLGDAVAQVQKVGGAQMASLGKIQLPRIPGKKNGEN